LSKRNRRLAPSKTRRLTRDEAERLGVKYSAKTRVREGAKRVSKRTPLYSDRQAHTASIKAKAILAAKSPKELREARRITKEKYRNSRIERRKTKRGVDVTEFKNLSKADLMKRLKAAGNREVMLKFTGGPGRKSSYKGRELEQDEWFSAMARIDAEELLDPEQFDEFLELNDIDGEPRFGLIVYS
jgi:hypothetical protein